MDLIWPTMFCISASSCFNMRNSWNLWFFFFVLTEFSFHRSHSRRYVGTKNGITRALLLYMKTAQMAVGKKCRMLAGCGWCPSSRSKGQQTKYFVSAGNVTSCLNANNTTEKTKNKWFLSFSLSVFGVCFNVQCDVRTTYTYVGWAFRECKQWCSA